MMFSKSTLLVAVVALSQLAVATPPACLLAAVNTQDDPSDLKSVCGPKASYVEGQIHSLCGSQANAAMQAFQASCKEAGMTVSSPSPKPSHSKPRPTNGGGSSHSSKQGGSGGSPTSKETKPTGGESNTPSKPTGGQSSGGNSGKTTQGHYSNPSVTPTPSNSAYTPPAGTGVTTSTYSNGTWTGKPAPTKPTAAAGRVDVNALMAVVAAGVVAAI